MHNRESMKQAGCDLRAEESFYRNRAYIDTADATDFLWSGMKPEPLLLKMPWRFAPLRVWSVNQIPIFAPLSRPRFNFRPITNSPCANWPAAVNAYLLFSLFLIYLSRHCLVARSLGKSLLYEQFSEYCFPCFQVKQKQQQPL